MQKKKKTGKNPHRSEIHARSRYKYLDPSRRFLEWVENLGIERTMMGRLLQRLNSRFNLRRVGVLFIFCLALSFLIFYELDFPYTVEVGEVAATDIKSPISFQIVDEVATAKKHKKAESEVAPVFDYDPDVYEKIFDRVYKAFNTMRTLVRQTQWPDSNPEREQTINDFFKHKSKFEKQLGVEVSDRIFEWLVKRKFSDRIENVVIRSLIKWSRKKIVDAPPNMLPGKDTPLVVRVVERGGQGQEYRLTEQEIRDYKKVSEFQIDGVRGFQKLAPKDRPNVRRLAYKLVVPNVSFNRQETARRKEKAREAVLPVQISVKQNQTIVNAGSIVQPRHKRILEKIRSLQSDRRTDFIALVAAVLLVTLVLVFFSYLRRFTTNRVRVDARDLAVMGVVTFIVVLITKVFLFMTDAAFVSKFGPFMPSTVFLFAAPVMAGPMLVGLLIASGEVVWLFTAFLSVTLAFMVDMNFEFLIVALMGGIAAARGVYACKKRNDIYWAGLRTGLINALAIACMMLLQKLGDGDLDQYLLWNVPAGFIAGCLSAMVALMIVPLLESVFNYTTDVKLLELVSLDHPLMKDMIVKAPGTYHHSLVVGSMVESAAQEISANALLGKVMAYYHDIGKTEHAQYFIENQRPDENPHDNVSPYMSKTILIAHVKDGAEKGIKYKLGKPIIDGILQHHGTTLISYFYNKALEEHEDHSDFVNEEDFRYPGPKPQFKEAALVMLADSIEAAARSLDEPTATRLQNIVKNVIQSKFLDGQLEECNLTLKDLSVIEQAFKRVLLGIYHQRIDYPHSPITRDEPSTLTKNLMPKKKKKGKSVSA